MEYRVLNLGAGVQSTTLALMYCKGELTPKPDAAIFADTGWEPREVYRLVWWIAGEFEKAGIKFYIAHKSSLREDALVAQVAGRATDGRRFASMPLYTRGESNGMVRRQCTSEYKALPLEKATKRWVMGMARGERVRKGVRLARIIGISADEAHRMRDSEHAWCTNVYPLCDWPQGSGRVMKRGACLEWLAENYPGLQVAKSSCLGCPFHNDKEWRKIKKNEDYWADVVEFDRAIRNPGGMNSEAFLHSARIPLEDVDLTDPDENQPDLFGQECTGMCGV